MEAAMELEDDVYFKDLSRQISLLIMDDDEDSLAHQYCPSGNLQAFNQAIHPARQAPIFHDYDHQTISKRSKSKGTGVFIPRSSNHRSRKNVRQGGRYTTAAADNKFQKPSDINHNSRSGGLPQHLAYNQSSHDHSFSLRRY